MLFVSPTRGHGGRYRVNIIMLFVRPTRGHGGRYRVNLMAPTVSLEGRVIYNVIRTCTTTIGGSR